MKTATLPDHAVSDALAILLTHLQTPNEEESESYQSNFEAGEQSNSLPQLRLQDIRIESAMVAFTAMVKHRLTTLRRQQNQFSPIYRLPTEILAHIFQKLLEDTCENEGIYDIVVELTRISSHWRNVAVSTPQLWTRIDSRYCEALVAASITRSRNMPLRLFITQSEEGTGIGQDESFLNVTLPHRSRWERVIWTSNNFLKLSQLYLEEITLPLLQKFEVWSDDEDMLPVPKSISHHAPLLRSLSILCCSFPVDAPGFSRLRTVNLQATVDSQPLSSAQWHSFLASSPELEVICAQGVYDESEAPVTPFQVSLPRLQRLALILIQSSIIGALLSAISLSGNTLPSIDIESPLMEVVEEEHVLDTVFAQSNPNAILRASIHQMISITARCASSEYGSFLEIAAEAESQPRLLRYRGTGWGLDVFRTLVSPNILPNLKVIKLDGSQFFQDGIFSSALPQCTSLERLSIQNTDPVGQSDRLLGICIGLTTVYSSSPDDIPSLTWPCPNLKYLEILIHDMDFSHVASLIQIRYGYYGASHSSVVQLEELTLSSSEFPEDPSETDDPDSIARIRQALNPLGTVVRRVPSKYFTEMDGLPE